MAPALEIYKALGNAEQGNFQNDFSYFKIVPKISPRAGRRETTPLLPPSFSLSSLSVPMTSHLEQNQRIRVLVTYGFDQLQLTCSKNQITVYNVSMENVSKCKQPTLICTLGMNLMLPRAQRYRQCNSLLYYASPRVIQVMVESEDYRCFMLPFKEKECKYIIRYKVCIY